MEQPRIPTKSQCKFETTIEAAEHNWQMLSGHGSIEQAKHADGQFPLAYGSAFQNSTTIRCIFKLHPMWGQLQQILSRCILFLLQHLSTQDRYKDVMKGLEFGNHKGVEKYPAIFKELTEKDIKFVYSFLSKIHSKCIGSPSQHSRTAEHQRIWGSHTNPTSHP